MSNSIVQVNVSIQVSPTPATLQQMGALISQGGTSMSPGSSTLLTQLSDLTPYLTSPAAITSLTWSGSVVTVAATAAHGLPVGQALLVNIAGATPAAYNGVFLATVTTTTAFTYPLTANPGAETVAGTWQAWSALELTQMATTFFAQGWAQGVYVLELGPTDTAHGIAALNAYLVVNPNSNYTPGATGYFYAYLVPRSWDTVASFLSLIASYESPTARTYFFVTTTLQNYAAYTALMKCVVALVECPNIGTWPANAFTAISYGAGIVTGTTTTAHGVLPGQYFTVAGVTPAGYNGTFLALPGTTASTLVYAVPAALGAESVLGTLLASLYASPGIGLAEFSHAANFYNWLRYNPSTTNRVAPFAFQFVYGVTAFPLKGFNSVLAGIKAAHVNYIGTGDEGGSSSTCLFWGTTMDGNDATYWYAVDWFAINTDLMVANAVINGSNNPINPLFYNQPGVDYLQAVVASVANRGITYGMILGQVIQTALDGPVLDANLNNGDYADRTVVNAVPFVRATSDRKSVV